MLMETEDVRIEPSSCAAFIGPHSLMNARNGLSYLQAHDLTPSRMKNATQLCWATGGNLVPEKVWQEYLSK
ncbi:MAG: D-serine ammonia-lyase, partial [Schwartzia sp.]|nr:D-serine ammonia-lyase [Schwartzia sp. (in: firmicutes)]